MPSIECVVSMADTIRTHISHWVGGGASGASGDGVWLQTVANQQFFERIVLHKLVVSFDTLLT